MLIAATWHYINKIAFLKLSDKAAIGPIDLNPFTELPEEQAETMNVVQAIKIAQLRINGTVKVSPEPDALMLCWLWHSDSDLRHQALSVRLTPSCVDTISITVSMIIGRC